VKEMEQLVSSFITTLVLKNNCVTAQKVGQGLSGGFDKWDVEQKLHRSEGRVQSLEETVDWLYLLNISYKILKYCVIYKCSLPQMPSLGPEKKLPLRCGVCVCVCVTFVCITVI
jgi:hypothetical protein